MIAASVIQCSTGKLPAPPSSTRTPIGGRLIGANGGGGLGDGGGDGGGNGGGDGGGINGGEGDGGGGEGEWHGSRVHTGIEL